MTQPETAAKKDTQRLQRAIVDGLEDVKAHDIAVFNTEHLSPLFERVIVASGTSNRQTKALAASVRDSVREAGFPKPRIEGEENGEWIIVDCGPAVAHIMQPAIRQYYHLEEIWGEKPVRLKFGAPKPAMPEADRAPAAKKAPAKKAPAKAPAKKSPATAKTPAKAPAKKSAGKAAPKKAAPARKPAAKKSGAPKRR
jgi:ribosome-associated protein